MGIPQPLGAVALRISMLFVGDQSFHQIPIALGFLEQGLLQVIV
jgi:hypothetical protein